MTTNEATFRGKPAAMPFEPRQDPILQWGSRVNEVYTNNTQKRMTRSYSGFLSEVGKDEEFDDAMTASGMQQILIQHSGGMEVTHWCIEQADLIPLITHVDTLSSIKQTGGIRGGMSLGWKNLENGQFESFLRMLVLYRNIYPEYQKPMMFTIKSTGTRDVIDALRVQYNVLKLIEESRVARNLPPIGYPFYAVAVRVAAGDEVPRGKIQVSNYAPIVNLAPIPLTLGFAKEVFIGKDQKLVNLVESMIDEAVEWSKQDVIHQSQVVVQPTMEPSNDDISPTSENAPRKRLALH